MKKGKYLIEYDCYVAENGNITQNDKEIKPYLNGGYMTVKLKINGLFLVSEDKCKMFFQKYKDINEYIKNRRAI